MNQPEPFPYGIRPAPKLSQTDKAALTRLALYTLASAILTHLARKTTR